MQLLTSVLAHERAYAGAAIHVRFTLAKMQTFASAKIMSPKVHHRS